MREPTQAIDESARLESPPFALLVLLVIVVVLGCYATTLGAPFVWDDHELVEGLRGLAHTPWHNVFVEPFWAGGAVSPTAYYRPIALLSFRLDAALYGQNPAGYHLTNVLAHTANTVLVAILARRSGAHSVAACGAALAFGLAPRLTESVAWISGRTDELALLGVLVAFWIWPRARFGAIWGAVALALGVLSKEVALAGVAALVVLEWRSNVPARVRFARLVPLTLCVGTALLARFLVLQNQSVVSDGLSTTARVGAACEALGDYCSMLLDSWRPNLQIGWLSSKMSWRAALGPAAALAALVFTVRNWRELSAWQTAMIALGFAALAAVLHVVPLPVGVMAADRFLYVPMAALVLGLASRLRPIAGERFAPPWVIVAGALIVVSFGAATVVRLQDWGDEAALWIHAFESASPDNPMPAFELGNLNYRVERLEPAARLYVSAVTKSHDRTTQDAIAANSANVSSLLGDHDRALRVLSSLAARRADAAEFQADLAVAQIQAFDFEGATRSAERLTASHASATQARGQELTALIRDLLRDSPAYLAARGDSLPSALTRARFSARAGNRSGALADWRKITLDPRATATDVHEALVYFVVNGDIDDVKPAAAHFAALGGRIDPGLEQAFELRRQLWHSLAGI